MRVLLGIICILFGLLSWGGQTVSAFFFKFAQRVGLQETDEGTDPLYREVERQAARWDALILWPLVIAGVLMVIVHPWWPVAGLLSAGIYLDTAGRELAKGAGLRRQGVRTGSAADTRKAFVLFGIMIALALILFAYSAMALARTCG